jgi:hypothetical protein
MTEASSLSITAVVTDEDGFCLMFEMSTPTTSMILTEVEARKMIELMQECLKEASKHKN